MELTMEIKSATAAEILEFKKAAAKRYAARGIDPKTAEILFEKAMAKLAAEIGLEFGPTELTKKDQPKTKDQALKKTKPGDHDKKASAKIDKIASIISSELARPRKR
jgi:hypothetical protein